MTFFGLRVFMRTPSCGLSSTTFFLDHFGLSCIVVRCWCGLIFSAGAFFFAVSWASPRTLFLRDRPSAISRETRLRYICHSANSVLQVAVLAGSPQQLGQSARGAIGFSRNLLTAAKVVRVTCGSAVQLRTLTVSGSSTRAFIPRLRLCNLFCSGLSSICAVVVLEVVRATRSHGPLSRSSSCSDGRWHTLESVVGRTIGGRGSEGLVEDLRRKWLEEERQRAGRSDGGTSPRLRE